MSDLISRQSTIIALANNRCGNDEWDLAVTHDVETVKKIPSVEPERKSGKWIEGEKTPGYIKWNCSECGLLIRNPQKPWYEYCPKCGADMRDVPETNDGDTESEDRK